MASHLAASAVGAALGTQPRGSAPARSSRRQTRHRHGRRQSVVGRPAHPRRIASLGITEVVSSPLSPWQNPYVERVIGSIRRECLDHVIILNDRHLRRILRAYLAYYHRSRTHLGLSKDAPDGRPACAASGRIIVSPEVGGLHHRYDRQAA